MSGWFLKSMVARLRVSVVVPTDMPKVPLRSILAPSLEVAFWVKERETRLGTLSAELLWVWSKSMSTRERPLEYSGVEAEAGLYSIETRLGVRG